MNRSRYTKEAGVSRRIDPPENSRRALHSQPSSCAGCSPVVRNLLETAQERNQPFRILERRCAPLLGKPPEEPYPILADTDVRPWCVYRLRYQAARAIMAEHQRRWRNGRTSTERYFAALSSIVEQIIPPPLHQRVWGSSPWRRTPPHPADLRCLRETASRHSCRRGVVHPWCIHWPATGRTTLISAQRDTLETTRGPRAARARDGPGTNTRSCRCDAPPGGHRQHPSGHRRRSGRVAA
jgi:hypothetical protein